MAWDLQRIAAGCSALHKIRMRGSDKVEAETLEIIQEIYEELQRLIEALGDEISQAMKRLAEWTRNVLNSVSCTSLEELAKVDIDARLAEYYHDREHQRQMQREAIPRERGRAAARYKAHRSMMVNVKARQHQRRRKYRSGANAGWY